MDRKRYSVPLHQLVSEFGLEIAYGPENHLMTKIEKIPVNRPALQLAGFFEGFHSGCIQVMGYVESLYLKTLTFEQRLLSFDRLLSQDIPLLVVAGGLDILPECLDMAQKHGVTLAKTKESTSDFIAAVTAALNVHLGDRTNVHGVLVEVYGEGVLLLGESGIGKSETAIELVKRGHRLIADDVVDIKRVSKKTLVGSAPEIIRHFIELRGIGIIDVRRIFGMGSVKPTENVRLVVHLELWEEGKAYERLGAEDMTTDILGIQVPSLRIPVKPGRNLAVIIEVAAMNNRNKNMGHNSAKEFSENLYNTMVAQSERSE